MMSPVGNALAGLQLACLACLLLLLLLLLVWAAEAVTAAAVAVQQQVFYMAMLAATAPTLQQACILKVSVALLACLLA